MTENKRAHIGGTIRKVISAVATAIAGAIGITSCIG